MMDITADKIDRADLIVLVDGDGHVEWSSHRDCDQVVDMLRKIADGIADGSLEG
jgi:hypothetical protein